VALSCAAGQGHRACPQEIHACLQACEGLLDDLVAAVAQNDREELGRGADLLAGGLAAARGAAEGFEALGQVGEVFVTDHNGTARGCLAFEKLAHLVNFLRFAPRKARNLWTAVRHDIDQAFGLQAAQRFAKRRPADAERVAQIRRDQPVARHEDAGQDRVSKLFHRSLLNGFAVHPHIDFFRHVRTLNLGRCRVPLPIAAMAA
jgi:hypothetical protein